MANIKYTNEQIHEVCRLLQDNVETKDIRIQTKFKIKGKTKMIPSCIIRNILNKKTHLDISDSYDFSRNTNGVIEYTDEQIRSICIGLQNGEPIGSIVKRTGIKQSVVKGIYSNNHFSEISKNYDFNFRRGQDNVNTEYQIRSACQLLANGVPLEQIKDLTNVKVNVLRAILNRIVYRNISREYDFSLRGESMIFPKGILATKGI